MPDLEDLQPGRFVAALYITETEKLWSRAEVLSRDGVSEEQFFISREGVKKIQVCIRMERASVEQNVFSREGVRKEYDFVSWEGVHIGEKQVFTNKSGYGKNNFS